MPDLTDFSDLAITAVQSDVYGCGHMRCVYPLDTLKKHGARVFRFIVNHGHGPATQRQVPVEIFDNCNTIILQRAIDPRLLDMIRGRGWQNGRDDLTVIYECDDDLTRIDPRNPSAYRKGKPAAGSYSPEVCHNIERVVKACDALFVSTPELASRWSHLNNRVFVLPNSIDFSFRPWHVHMPRHEMLQGKVVLGWTGGAHHIGDEGPLVGVMRDVLLRHDDIVLAVCSNPVVMWHFLERWGVGKTEVKFGRKRFIGDPALEDKWFTIDPVDFARYPFVIDQFDIGLAPLTVSTFNFSKSELRLLEYGAKGVPYVASRLPAYARFHKETGGIGGYLAGKKQEWRDALETLICDHEERAAKAAAIAGAVKDQYDTEQLGLRWGSAIRQVKAGAISTWEPMLRPGVNQSCPCGSGVKYRRCCYDIWG